MYRRHYGKYFSIVKNDFNFFYWTEVLKHIQYQLDRMPVSSMTALAKNEFAMAGELMAASIVQGRHFIGHKNGPFC